MRTSLILPMMLASALLPAFACASADKHAENLISIEDAVKNNLISVKILGEGGHTGEVIKVKLRNLKNHPVDCSIEAGRRLDSEDDSEQDILITKSVTLSLLANQTKTVAVSGMCCQADNSSPDSGSVFSLGKMADPNLVNLAKFIDLNKWYDNEIAQSGVWVVSDSTPFEDIGGDDPVSKKLQEFISKIIGKPIPKYKFEYAQRNNGPVHASMPASIKGTFEYELFSNGLITFGIYDSNGLAVQMFFADVPRNKGSYGFNYQFNTFNLPKGDYYARLRFDGQVKKEQKFTF